MDRLRVRSSEETAGQSVAALLRAYRRAAGLTQEQLAERAGLSVRGISDLERDEQRVPRRETLELLVRALALGPAERATLEQAIHQARVQGQPAPEPDPQPAATPAAPAAVPAALPTGMLSVLIADVRGYSTFTHQHGDAAGARLALRFTGLAEEVIAAAGGRLVEIRGDEVLGVFTSAHAALRAATGLVARCAAEASAELPLRAGVGLDVGEPVVVPGGYRGEVINTAARLCAQADMGEVLASEAVVALARRVDGLVYQDRGALSLKGLGQPVRTWRVEVGAAPVSAPAPEVGPPQDVVPAPAVGAATAGAPPPHNLPANVGMLIGRAEAQAQVLALLAQAPLVTLTGSGGVGKTRLALAVAQEALARFPDGVWVVELAPLADATLVPQAVAQALGLRDEGGRPLTSTLAEHLKTRRLLLVLDNCEHLVAACAVLAASLLRGCPGLHLLATSREGLEVAGERRYQVASLPVPDLAHLPPPERLAEAAAVALFVARAQERRPDFALSAQNARAVAAVCAHLDGIPLALELAAARVGSLPVEAIAARLDDRFRLLTGGGRDVLPRQRTLRAALDWSYDLLSEQEQRLLDRLVVFAGGWTLAAAEAVCAGEGVEDWEILDLLGGLVNKSLVLLEEDDGEEGRYGLLETVRRYGAERLATGGAEAAVRARHLGYCVALAEEGAPHLRGPAQGMWLARLEAEHDNLRAALGWARERGLVEEGLRLAGALWRFWWTRGHFSEGRGWLAGLLAAGAGSPAVRALALQGAGTLAAWQGEYAVAETLHEEALALRRAVGDRRGIAMSLNSLGNVALRREDYGRAAALYEESLALYRALDDRWGSAMALNNLGNIALQREDYGRAAVYFEESLALCRALEDRLGVAVSLHNLGFVATRQGDHGRGVAFLRESLRICHALGLRYLEQETLEALAHTLVADGQADLGAQLGGAAEALAEVLDVAISAELRAGHERLLARRAAAGEEAFAAAWATGRALTLDEAVHLALEGYATAPKAGAGG